MNAEQIYNSERQHAQHFSRSFDPYLGQGLELHPLVDDERVSGDYHRAADKGIVGISEYISDKLH